MAAEQAAELAEENVVVVPSKTVPQGMAAMLAFNPTADIEVNKEGMTEALQSVKTGQLTFAVRDTNIDGLSIEKDDFMGIADGKIILKDKDKQLAAKELLKALIDEDSEIVTILQGEDTSSEEVDSIVKFLETEFEDVEVEVHNGKQPLYAYIFSVE